MFWFLLSVDPLPGGSGSLDSGCTCLFAVDTVCSVVLICSERVRSPWVSLKESVSEARREAEAQRYFPNALRFSVFGQKHFDWLHNN